VQVAKLAGLPAKVVRRARALLADLESQDRQAPLRRAADDLPLFAAAQQPALREAEPDALRETLDALDPDDMSPREALDALYRLRKLRAAEQD
jgi:DNA mismatch repair protein MutS